MKYNLPLFALLSLVPVAAIHSPGATNPQLQPARPALDRPSRPSVGAIRWDAWSGGRVTEEVQRTLAPAKYHDRLPWFAAVTGDNQVRIDGSPPEIMDQEIDFAADAGLDYWAFLLYPESDSMSQALNQYLKSPRRGRLHFCVILHNALGVPEAAWPSELARVISLLKEPGYQKVLGGRPLVFEFQARLGGQFPYPRFAEFRRAAQESGLNPYCVFMGWSPAADFRRESTNGFDAVSAYASGSDAPAFAQLVRQVESGYWQKAAEAQVPYVPLATTGWDKRPRKENPVSWEKDHAYHRQAVFPSRATPAEIAAHLERGLAFVRDHPELCPANAILLYAWNEYDEGGWLAPTWTPSGRPDTARLDAIRGVLRPGGTNTGLSSPAIAPGESRPSTTQYILFNRAPGQGMNQSVPESLGRKQFDDPRHLSNGWIIPSEGYADQPYLVKTDDGAWLCAMTTGKGTEGAGGQHVVSMRSTDRGRTWSEIVPIEPADGPEASYAVLLKVPGGRIYAFYNHNTDHVREVKREDQGAYPRVDSLGHYVFKFSEDHGRTWSARRYDVPVREFACDRTNVYGGKLRFFWNVGRPLILGDTVLLVLHKVGAMGAGFFAQSEGAFLQSRNLLAERDPEKITFETLPDGDVGLRTPAGGGRVAEEQSLVKLSDGSMFCVYRTIDGWPASAYSRDGGHTWTQPAYMTYEPGGRRVKHPRAANFAWNCSNGQFLYWFHNHGGRFVGELGAAGKGGRSPYDDRNPAWLAAGREVDTPQGKRIEWSQPEILLYDDDPFIRMSYPDLLEESGTFYVTETQKTVGRLHEIPGTLIDGLFKQFANRSLATNGLMLNLRPPFPSELKMPLLPELHQRDTKSEDQRGKDLRAGFSLDLWLKLDSLATGTTLLDSRADHGKGLCVTATEAGTIRITLNDGRQEASWESDRGALQSGRFQHVVITVDGGPKIITFVVDGRLGDGGEERQFGWGRFSPTLRAPNGSGTLRIGKGVQSLRLYARALRTSEAVGNFRAGLDR